MIKIVHWTIFIWPYAASIMVGLYFYLGVYLIFIIIPIIIGFIMAFLSIIFRYITDSFLYIKNNVPKKPFSYHATLTARSEGIAILLFTILLVSFSAGHLRIANLSRSTPIIIEFKTLAPLNMQLIGTTSNGMIFSSASENFFSVYEIINISKNIYAYRSNDGFEIICHGSMKCIAVDKNTAPAAAL